MLRRRLRHQHPRAALAGIATEGLFNARSEPENQSVDHHRR